MKRQSKGGRGIFLKNETTRGISNLEFGRGREDGKEEGGKRRVIPPLESGITPSHAPPS